MQPPAQVLDLDAARAARRPPVEVRDLSAYAPDPDADYEAGRRQGWLEAFTSMAEATVVPPTWSPLERRIRGWIYVGLPVFVIVALLAARR